MKILIVTFGFFPGKEYGGPPVSTDNFCSLMQEEECYIVTRNHDLKQTAAYEGIPCGEWVERSNCKVMYLPDEEYKSKRFEEIVQELNPDMIYLQSLYQPSVLPMLQLAKKYRIPTLLAPRGELCKGAFHKRYKKVPYNYLLRSRGLIKNICFQSTSEEETEAIIRHLGVKAEQIHSLPNIPSMKIAERPERGKKPGEAKLVFISRISWKKNLAGAIRFLKGVSGNVIFDIYGPLEDEKHWAECKKEIGELPSNITVSYKGIVDHDDVSKTFAGYDAFLFPTLSENYGHVIAESLLAGTPVIISDQTPWNDINGTGAGRAIPLDDEEGFRNAVQTVVDAPENVPVSVIDDYLNRKLQITELKGLYKKALDEICGISKS